MTVPSKKVYRISNDNIDDYLILNNRSIKRLEDVKTAKSKIDWQCLVPHCNYIWKATPCHLKEGSGCPKCARRIPITNDSIDRWLSENSKSIKRIDDVGRAKDKIVWKCLVIGCDHKWIATPDDIKSHNGCPKCANRLVISDEDMDQWLIDNNKPIKRIGSMNGVHTKIKWQCLDCNHIWLAPPNPIRCRDQGCPICHILGYNEKLIYEYLSSNQIDFDREKNIREIDSNEKRSLRIDFYFPKYKSAIEYNGLQHYSPWRFSKMSHEEANARLIIQQERDKYKREFCKNSNINLIEIDGREYKDHKLITYIGRIIDNWNNTKGN